MTDAATPAPLPEPPPPPMPPPTPLDHPGILGLLVPTSANVTLPEPKDPFYLYHGTGLYLSKRTIFGDVLVPTKDDSPTVPSLDLPKDGFYRLTGVKVPLGLVLQAWRWFANVYTTHGTEAELLILYSRRKTPTWQLWAPPQYVSHASVNSRYDPEDLPKGYAPVGTLHSHCDFGAFHSGTDSRDASEFDGAHFTIGEVNHKVPQVACMMSSNGKEFHYSLADMVDAEDVAYTDPPAAWMEQVFANRPAPWSKQHDYGHGPAGQPKELGPGRWRRVDPATPWWERDDDDYSVWDNYGYSYGGGVQARTQFVDRGPAKTTPSMPHVARFQSRLVHPRRDYTLTNKNKDVAPTIYLTGEVGDQWGDQTDLMEWSQVALQDVLDVLWVNGFDLSFHLVARPHPHGPDSGEPVGLQDPPMDPALRDEAIVAFKPPPERIEEHIAPATPADILAANKLERTN